MAHYQCYKCSAIMVAEETPERCESCGAPAAEAFPGGVGVEDPSELGPVDHLFDVTLGSGAGLSPTSTLELDEEDLLEPEPSAPRLVTPSSRVPPPPSPLEVSPVKPMAGRVAYPLPPEQDPEQEQEPPPSPVEDEMAVAGLPPVPPRPQPVLASQTESLAARRARRLRRTARRVVLVGAGALLLVLATVILFWPGKEGNRVSGGVPDAGVAPDAARPDATRLDQQPDTPRSDLRRPDLRRPDLRRPDLAPRVDQRASLRPSERARPTERAPRPGAAPGHAPAPSSTPDAAPQQTPQEHYRAGLRLLLRGQLNAAVARFNAALDGDPRLSLAYRGLGLAYEKQGRRAQAVEAFRRYLRIRPDAPDAAAVRKRIEKLEP